MTQGVSEASNDILESQTANMETASDDERPETPNGLSLSERGLGRKRRMSSDSSDGLRLEEKQKHDDEHAHRRKRRKRQHEEAGEERRETTAEVEAEELRELEEVWVMGGLTSLTSHLPPVSRRSTSSLSLWLEYGSRTRRIASRSR